ncbi:MAG: diphosphomevalonate decarboxylase [Spirochaetota bacterium]|jgi:diphosphomevalonate decarboxylase|nr:diphosphomevalonate decarboxylase [Spirochaetota bacterium]
MNSSSVTVRAAPSLALIKYWGKANGSEPPNRPATSSIAVSLEGLYSEARVTSAENRDCVILDGREMDGRRYAAFFENIRACLDVKHFYECICRNNFPSAAGLASSSSGFAALAAGCARLSSLLLEKPTPDLRTLSALARVGSASAARAVYPGFVILKANAEAALPLYAPDFWPELRVIVARISDEAKPRSSRDAMEHTRATSPYYPAWLRDSRALFTRALAALERRDLAQLGPLIRASTYRMFGSILAADPVIIYWKPLTLALLEQLEELRGQGLLLFETMDAGPQVKIFCLEREARQAVASIQKAIPELADRLSVLAPGGGLTWPEQET